MAWPKDQLIGRRFHDVVPRWFVNKTESQENSWRVFHFERHLRRSSWSTSDVIHYKVIGAVGVFHATEEINDRNISDPPWKFYQVLSIVLHESCFRGRGGRAGHHVCP